MKKLLHLKSIIKCKIMLIVNTVEACRGCFLINFSGKYQFKDSNKIVEESGVLRTALIIEQEINIIREQLGMNCSVCGNNRVDCVKIEVEGKIARHFSYDGFLTAQLFAIPKDNKVEISVNTDKWSADRTQEEECINILQGIELNIRQTNYSNPFFYLRARNTINGWKTICKIQGFSIELAQKLRSHAINLMWK